jgi:hypothetical protein
MPQFFCFLIISLLLKFSKKNQNLKLKYKNKIIKFDLDYFIFI